MTTIPASEIVSVTPNVLAAAGTALDLNGLLLDNSTRVPIGTVQSFPTLESAVAYFGGSSSMAALAAIYFAGFEGSNKKPGAMLVSQYNEDDVAAYLRGGDVSDLTTAELQALSGAFSVTIDGVAQSATINLSTATSFSVAAGLIAAALDIVGQNVGAITGSISGTTLTVTDLDDGVLLAANQVLDGSGVTAGTYILNQIAGTPGGIGTYTVTPTQTAASQDIEVYDPAVSFDSVSGGFVVVSGSIGEDSTITFASGALATSLLMTSATGAVLSQGADAASPAAYMNALIQVSQNWASFMLTFDPDAADEHTIKMEFADWVATQNDRWAFVCWDTDLAGSASDDVPTCMGAEVAAAEISGVVMIGRDSADYEDLVEIAAFMCGAIASLDTEQTNGRATMAFRRQSGLTASVTSALTASNLRANGYNYYGAYGTANDEFVFFYPGSISGDFAWIDSYVNEIWMTNAFQLALMTLMISALSIPYTTAGYAQIEATLGDPIAAALNFGAIRAGVPLSQAQATAVNQAAGARVSDVIQTRGWYLQVQPATAAVRAARGSPPCKFWYTDGQSVQEIDLASYAIP